MSDAAISTQVCISDCSDDIFAAMANNAEEPASKRARIEVKHFGEIDLSEFALKDKGKGQNGHIAFPLLGGEILRFNLTVNDWTRSPFGFDTTGKYEKPSFLGGKAPENPNAQEGLSLRLELQNAQAEFLGQLDSLSQQAFAKLVPDAKWNPLVAKNPLFRSSMCKVAVILKGSDLTRIAVVVDGKVHRVEGWENFEPFVKRCSNFSFTDVKLTVRVKKIWNVAGKAGLGLEATQLVLRPTQKPIEADCFGDDSELLA